jgi:hypothetical protein
MSLDAISFTTSPVEQAQAFAAAQQAIDDFNLPLVTKKRKAGADEDDDEEGSSKKRRRGDKKDKDPEMPKKPPSAYLMFQNEIRGSIKEKNPDQGNKEVMSQVAELWARLKDEEKQVSRPHSKRPFPM